ncbi:hypothetical protein [Kribbella sp. NPDC003557]|uniref:hypothetical protein n=1 Tax=Kribbella sp. NPDC003557 TaxID=3154449 RepID=UPI0033A152A9
MRGDGRLLGSLVVGCRDARRRARLLVVRRDRLIDERLTCRVGFIRGRGLCACACRFQIARLVICERFFTGVPTTLGSRCVRRLLRLWSGYGRPLLTAYGHTTQLMTKRCRRLAASQAASSRHTRSLRTNALLANAPLTHALLAGGLLTHG